MQAKTGLHFFIFLFIFLSLHNTLGRWHNTLRNLGVKERLVKTTQSVYRNS